MSAANDPLPPLYILAGGHSSRFGSDKALAPLAGIPLLQHVAQQFAGLASTITLVANDADKYRHLGYPIIPDLHANLGPIAGLQAACRHAQSGWLWLSGCDTLLSNPALLQPLLTATHAEAPIKLQVAAFKTTFWEPLPALYHTSLLPIVEQQIVAQERALWRLIERARHQAHLAESSPVTHINIPEELHQFAQRAKQNT